MYNLCIYIVFDIFMCNSHYNLSYLLQPIENVKYFNRTLSFNSLMANTIYKYCKHHAVITIKVIQ